VTSAIILAVLCAQPADAADAGEPDAVEQLEALDEQLVSVATAIGAQTAQREAPAVVTVLSREEIHDLHARDLIDVLRYVPGFDFISDVEDSVGLTVRGQSTLEGKALVLLDGMLVNDLGYGNVLFGNRFAVENIERIEIIRGPGSTIYGGFAELAVINIVTRPDRVKNALRGSVLYGQLPTTMGRFNGSLQGSGTVGDLQVWGSAYAGTAVRSDQAYLVDGTNTVPLQSYSTMRPLNVSLGAEWKGLQAQFIYDWYHNDTPVYDDLSRPLHKEHKHLFGSLKYTRDLGDLVALQVFVRYQRQNPWVATDEFAIVHEYYNDLPIDRILGGATVTVKPLGWLSVLAGSTFNYDTSTAPPSDDPRVQTLNFYNDANGNPTQTLSFWNVAAFAEAVARTPIVNVTLGARYEHQSLYGDSFVPRVGLTKEVGHFHAKVLFGGAFRPPTFYNLSLNTNIKPETATVFEAEAGYQFTSWLYTSVNVFDDRLRSVIVYQTNPDTGASSYLNGGTSATHGIEAEVKLKASFGYANLAYSYYAAVLNGVDQYLVEGHPELNLGIPAHKFTLRGNARLHQHVSVSPGLVVFSERFALEQPGNGADFQLTRFPPTALVDLFVSVHDLPVRGLELSVGVHDLFNSKYTFASFYNSGTNALPSPGREFQLRLSYAHDFL
jgi:outer membrane receptor protein involved in Fe transport